jgi:ribose 5-phosphate isomerase B
MTQQRTPFTGEQRHVRRIAMLTAYETTSALPPLSSTAGPDA